MTDVVRIGIIALGGAGRAHLARFLDNPKAKVAALYDPKEDVLRQVAEQFSSSLVKLATTNLEEFLAFPEIEAVSICSPDHCHADHAIKALERGWHVLCEKPLATTVEDCQRIMEAACRSGKKVTVHHQMRFVPTFERAKELVDSGYIGKVFAIEADYYHDMRRRAVQFDNWRLNPDTFQNIVLGGACHPLDLMQWVIGDEIAEVFAYANHLAFEEYPDVDTVLAVLKFRSGVLGRMTMTVGCRRPQYNPLVVLGSEGTIVNGLILTENGARGITHIPAVGRWQPVIGRLLARSASVINYPFNHYEHDLACRRLIDRFLDAILEDKPLPVTLEESTDVIRVCQAVIESYRTGQPVAVKRISH